VFPSTAVAWYEFTLLPTYLPTYLLHSNS
jgi:hypothetical protein